jgi:hypothetical protein
MDKDIIEYCTKTISFINDYNNNYEKIIALLLRELKENDLVYIDTKNIWYKYDKNKKIWSKYNFRIILSKITELYEFFDNIMIKYLNTENVSLNSSNKNRFKSVSKSISENIFGQKINLISLEKECKIVFKIDIDI